MEGCTDGASFQSFNFLSSLKMISVQYTHPLFWFSYDINGGIKEITPLAVSGSLSVFFSLLGLDRRVKDA